MSNHKGADKQHHSIPVETASSDEAECPLATLKAPTVAVDQLVAAEETPRPPQKAKGTRNRLTDAGYKAKKKAVAVDYRAGHPLHAIMVKHGLRKEQLHEMLAELFTSGELTPVLPKYEVVPVSCMIRQLGVFVNSACKYVHVIETEEGIILSPFSMEKHYDKS